MNTHPFLHLVLALVLTAPLLAAEPPLIVPPASPEQPVRTAASDSGAAPKMRHKLTPWLSFGSKAEIESEARRDFDLDEDGPDSLTVFVPRFSFAFSYDPAPWFQAFVNTELSHTFINDSEEESRLPDDNTRVAVRDAFVRLITPAGLSLQAGRQRFKDSREWLFDERLDAVRLAYRHEKWTAEIAVGQENFGDDDILNSADEGEAEETNNFLVHVRYDINPKLHAAAYALIQEDQTSDEESPRFFGIHLDGEIANDLEVWLEAAHVRGRDSDEELRAWGFDLGATYEFDYDIKPSITFGYAFGTGDADTGDDVDRGFRQTGLQDNSAKFNGVTRLKYYGEVLDPELNNLNVLTAGIGIRPTKRSSVDLVYHHYLQHHRDADRISDADIRVETNGLDRNIGGELDLVAGYREIDNLDLELTLGYFFPGQALATGADGAFLAAIKIRYGF